MLKRLKVKLHPNKKQADMIDRHFDAYRFCYNLCLEYKSTMWKYHKIDKGGYEMQSEILQIRKEVDWLGLCKAECIRDAALQVERSFKGFYNGKGYPKFKSKNGEQSFTSQQSVSSKNSEIKFFRQRVKYKDSNKYKQILDNNKIKQITFKKDRCGDYWATCLVDIPETKILPKTDKVIGLDLGLKELLITSNGEMFKNSRFLYKQKYKLRRLNRKFSKTKKGGCNREKLRVKIAKVHRKISRQREHHYHQITNKIISENQTIIIETLKIQNMVRNHKLAKSINDVSWSLLTGQLEYKCKWYGRELIKVDTFFPSSKTCSNCGNIKKELKLSERVYNCEVCSFSLDRDVNAAINIRNQGLKKPRLTVEDADNSQANEAVNYYLTF